MSPSVIQHWITLCCEEHTVGGTNKLEDSLILEDESGKNILLKTLLDAASSPSRHIISDGHLIKLIYQSWIEGGKTWSECSIRYIASEEVSPVITETVISMASAALTEDINADAPADHALLELVCQSWANRAFRLIAVHPDGDDLDLVGLSNIELWDKAALSQEGTQSEFLFLCLMYLLNSVDGNKQNLLFKNSETSLFVHIQACISKSEFTPHLVSFQSRTSRNNELVETLGGREAFAVSLLEDCCMNSIQLLSSLLKDESSGDVTIVNNTLTGLSFLMSLLFPSALNIRDANEEKSQSDDVIAADVQEGDSYWYEKGEQRVRVKATVVKIHRDDFPNLYFTIREEGSNGERQTVASRLKRNPASIESDTNLLPDEGETSQRERVGRCVVDKLVKPFLQVNGNNAIDRVRSEVAAECTNIVVSQCGLVSFGIGSVRYEIFQAISSIERDLCDALSTSEPSLGKCIPLLRFLSLSMGYGIYSTPSQNNVSVLKMDTSGSIDKLMDLYDNQSWLEVQRASVESDFHSSVLMWLASSVSAVKDGETIRRVYGIIHSIADIVLPDDSPVSLTNSLLLMNAARSLQVVADRCIDYSSIDNDVEKYILSKLTYCFVNISLDDSSSDLWIETFASLLEQNYKETSVMLLPAATSFLNELCDCLFDPVKRWCAFQLLQIFTKSSQPLQPEDNVVIPPETEKQLSVWRNALDEEEAIELEEDVTVAAQWLPSRIMSLLQSIENSSALTNSDPQVHLTGNLLFWIVALDILDVAGAADMRNRPHISSYIYKTNAHGCVMNLALQEADLNISSNENIFACLDLDCKADFTVQKVATLAVFRTVESLPTLVKTWYNDDCPRFMRQKLSSFVESGVAPVTLKRELVRIKEATSFGEMSVSGSLVSREIVATYQQDEVRREYDQKATFLIVLLLIKGSLSSCSAS